MAGGARLVAPPDFVEVVVIGQTDARLVLDKLHIGGVMSVGPAVMPVVACGDVGEALVRSRQ